MQLLIPPKPWSSWIQENLAVCSNIKSDDVSPNILELAGSVSELNQFRNGQGGTECLR